MNDTKFKRSLTTLDAKQHSNSALFPNKYNFKNIMNVKTNKNVEIAPHNREFLLMPLIQPIIQPIAVSEEKFHKKTNKRNNLLHLAKIGAINSMDYSKQFQSGSFITKKNDVDLREQQKETLDNLKYYSSSMILNSQSVLPIDLTENKNQQQADTKLDQQMLPYIGPNRFEETLVLNKPSYSNNYRQSGTNPNSFKRSSKNFSIHSVNRRWLRSIYKPTSLTSLTSSWVKQNDLA